MHIFAVHRKRQVIGVTSVVLNLVFQSNDIVVCQCFFVFCILELAYVAWEPATLYNDIAWLLNQDTCQLRYKSSVPPLLSSFKDLHQQFYQQHNLTTRTTNIMSSINLLD